MGIDNNIINIVLNNGDRLIFDNKVYKVMKRFDTSYMLRQLGFGLSRYIKSVILRQISFTIVDGYSIQSNTDTPFLALVQPLKYSELMLKPESQRSFDWLKITPFTLTGNVDYHVIEDYQDS